MPRDAWLRAFKLGDKRRPVGSTHVIRRSCATNVNFRTQLLCIIKRGEIKPWPKLFQNLRATRKTELAEV